MPVLDRVGNREFQLDDVEDWVYPTHGMWKREFVCALSDDLGDGIGS